MRQYRIPNTDLLVSALCFGTSGVGTEIRGSEVDRLIASYLDAGGSFFDTAHCYAFWVSAGLGASERELAASLRRLGKFDNVVVATKGGHPDGGENYRRPDYYISEGIIKSDIDESLDRLGSSHIDLYYLHRDDTRVPVEDIIGILNLEIDKGRIRYIGASNWTSERVASANEYASKNGLHGFVASELQWSLAEPNWKPGPDPIMRTVTQDDSEWHASAGIPIVAYSSTAGGYFAGKNSDTFDSPVNRLRRERANRLAEEMNCSTTQIALAYLMHQKPLVIPIFRTKAHTHLADILGSAQVTLSEDQLRWLKYG